MQCWQNLPPWNGHCSKKILTASLHDQPSGSSNLKKKPGRQTKCMAKISNKKTVLSVWIKYKRNEFIRLTSSVTSESYHHARVSTIPSLGHFERRQKGNDQNSPDGFFVAYFWRHKQQRKRLHLGTRETLAFGKRLHLFQDINFLPAEKRLHLGTQETLWKALDSVGSKQIRFSLTELIFPSWIWTNLHISSDHRLSWDTKDSKLKIKSTSRIQRMVDTSWNPRGELAQRGDFFCVNLSEFAGPNDSFDSTSQINWIKWTKRWRIICQRISESFELSQASNELEESLFFSSARCEPVLRVCLSKTRAAYVLRRAPHIGKRHMKKNIDSNVFHKE